MLNKYRIKAKKAIRSAERFQGFAPIASYDFFLRRVSTTGKLFGT